MTAEASEFAVVDKALHPQEFVNYLDSVSMLSAAQGYKRQTFALLDLAKGSSVLDVGCGTGDDTIALAAIVGATGRAVGIDVSETMVEESRRRGRETGSAAEFDVADAHQLDFPDESFDACRSDRTFQHLREPAAAISEMIRVVRRGSPIVISDPDWATLLVDSPERSLTRHILNWLCDNIPANGWIGRSLPRLFRERGLNRVGAIPATAIVTSWTAAEQLFQLGRAVEGAREAGLISDQEAAEWVESMKEADRAERFFSSLGGFIVVGRK